jgi:hypothetical protein
LAIGDADGIFGSYGNLGWVGFPESLANFHASFFTRAVIDLPWFRGAESFFTTIIDFFRFGEID